jgi:hypothetical protein
MNYINQTELHNKIIHYFTTRRNPQRMRRRSPRLDIDKKIEVSLDFLDLNMKT